MSALGPDIGWLVAFAVGLGALFFTNRVFYVNLFAQRLYYDLYGLVR